jgi:carboxymethylenebutenolidase
MVEALDAHLSSVGANYQIEWYPGTQHGFVFPRRAGIYHEPSAEQHWDRLRALYGRNLS